MNTAMLTAKRGYPIRNDGRLPLFLEKLSFVELYCAQNWGKPEIAHAFSKVRLGKGHRAIITDLGVRVRDVYSTKEVEHSCELRVTDGLNAGTIISGRFQPRCLFPRLRECLASIGVIASPEFCLVNAEIELGLYLYNRLSEEGMLNNISGPAQEDFLAEISKLNAIPGEILIAHRALDHSLLHLAVIVDWSGWCVLIPTCFNKGGQTIRLFKRPLANMFFGQERLEKESQLPVVLTDDPGFYLANQDSGDMIVIGSFGTVQDLTSNDIEIFRGHRIRWVIFDSTPPEFKKAFDVLTIFEKADIKIRVICESYLKIEINGRSSFDELSIEEFCNLARSKYQPIPQRFTPEFHGLINTDKILDFNNNHALIDSILHEDDITIFEEYGNIPSFFSCREFVHGIKGSDNYVMGYPVFQRPKKILIILPTGFSRRLVRCLGRDGEDVDFYELDFDRTIESEKINRVLDKTQSKFIIIIPMFSKAEVEKFRSLLVLFYQHDLTTVVEWNHALCGKNSEIFSSLFDHHYRLLPSKKKDGILMEDMASTEPADAMFLCLRDGRCKSVRPATLDERSQFPDHSQSLDSGENITFAEKQYPLEKGSIAKTDLDEQSQFPDHNQNIDSGENTIYIEVE